MTIPINMATKQYNAVSLSEMNQSSLMSRIDTKFIMHRNHLPYLLNELVDSYNLLEINNKREMEYETVYFDTPCNKMFLDHHNQRGLRYKVRKRHYLANDQAFLEIKKKGNKGRTEKSRISLETISTSLSNDENDFIEDKTPYTSSGLIPKLNTDFIRLSAISKDGGERLTIDYNLRFTNCNTSETKELEKLVIIELKQEKIQRSSPCFKMIKKSNGRETSISKYCVGMALLNLENKTNRFRSLLRLIDKI